MRLLIGVLFCIVSIYSASAQIFRMNFSAKYVKDAYRTNHILTDNEQYTWFVRVDKKFIGTDYFIEQYNTNSLELVQEDKINLPEIQNRTTELNDLLLIHKKPYLTVSNRYKNQTLLYGYPADNTSNLQFIDTLSSTNFAWIPSVFHTNHELAQIVRNKKDNTLQLNITKVDSLFRINKPSSFFTKLPYQSTILEKGCILNDKEYVFIFSHEIITNTVHTSKNYYLVYIKKDSITTSQLKLEHREINQLVIQPYQNSILVAGTYEKKTETNQHGVFYLQWDKNKNSILESQFKDLNTNFFQTNIDAMGTEKIQTNYTIKGLFPKKDASIAFVLEEYKYQKICFSDSRTNIVTCNDHYYHNDIIVVNFNPTSPKDWITRIPKIQHAYNASPTYHNTAVTTDGENIYLFYNDHIKNLNATTTDSKIRELSNLRKAVATAVTVDKDGVFQKKMLTDENEKGIRFQQHILRPDGNLIWLLNTNPSAFKWGMRISTMKF